MWRASRLIQIRGSLATSFSWETVPINIHIWAKFWLSHNIKLEKKSIAILRIKWFFIIVCKILGSLHPRILCVKLGWNLSNCSLEEDFYISSMYFLSSPLVDGRYEDFLWQLWLNLAIRFWRRRFLSSVNVFLLLWNHAYSWGQICVYCQNKDFGSVISWVTGSLTYDARQFITLLNVCGNVNSYPTKSMNIKPHGQWWFHSIWFLSPPWKRAYSSFQQTKILFTEECSVPCLIGSEEKDF